MLTNALQHVHEVVVRIDIVQLAGGQQALHNADHEEPSLGDCSPCRTVDGTGSAIEFTGSEAHTLCIKAQMTVCNMVTEAGLCRHDRRRRQPAAATRLKYVYR